MVEVDADRPGRPAHPARRVRGTPTAHRHYFMWDPGQPKAAMRRLHVLHHAGQRAVLPAFPRHDLRDVLPGARRQEHPLSRLHGLGHALVLSPRLPRRAPRRAPDRPVPPRVLPAGRRPRVRDLLDEAPRRRGHGLQLRAHGPHRLWTPGELGGLAPRLGPSSAPTCAPLAARPTGPRCRSGQVAAPSPSGRDPTLDIRNLIRKHRADNRRQLGPGPRDHLPVRRPRALGLPDLQQTAANAGRMVWPLSSAT
jgi:hypothetical protein